MYKHGMLRIDVSSRKKAPRVSTVWVQKAARKILQGLELKDAELSIALVDDESIHGLNKQWRGKDKPTDVLSFSPQNDPFVSPQCHLGDVIISLDTAAKQAERIGHSLEDEVLRLLIHGILHLMGHDHVHGGRQARNMKNEETRLLDLFL